MAFAPLLIGALAAGGTAATAGASLATVLAVGGTAMAATGAVQQASYQSAVASNNAKIAQYNASQTANQMQTQAQRTDNQAAQTEGQQKAAYAGGNIITSSGTPAEVTDATQRNVGIANQDIYQSGGAKVRDYQNQSANFAAQASMYKEQAIMSAIGGVVNAGSSFAGDSWKNPMAPKSLLGDARPTRATFPF